MSKSQETWNKKEREKKKQKLRKEKEERKQERKELAKEQGGKSFDDMIAYVDENGNFSSTPPDPKRRQVRLEDIEIGVPKQADFNPADGIREGIVTFFNETKGFGFIVDQETKESIFVHANGLVDQIKENNRVSYEVEMGQKGPNAVGVKLVK
jgi:cold shock CspA family protein